MNQQTVEKIINAAVQNMVNRANIEITGTYCAKVVTGADIFSDILANPTGNTSRRLAEFVALGINYYAAAQE